MVKRGVGLHTMSILRLCVWLGAGLHLDLRPISQKLPSLLSTIDPSRWKVGLHHRLYTPGPVLDTRR